MENILISPDKNTVTSHDTEHFFQHEDELTGGTCKVCSLFNECINFQDTAANEFPFPCVAENRSDGQYGHFKTRTVEN